MFLKLDTDTELARAIEVEIERAKLTSCFIFCL